MYLSPEREQQLLDLSDAKSASILEKTGAHAFFPGKRRRDGELTDEDCIVVLVSKKKPIEELSDNEIVPAVLSNNIHTDVMQVPAFRSQAWCGGDSIVPPVARVPYGCPDNIYDPDTLQPYSSIQGGASIGSAHELDAGTLGLICRDRESRGLVGVTSNHGVGIQPYIAGPQHPIISYDITDDGFNFIISKDGTSHTNPEFDNIKFDTLIAGNVYKFTSYTDLHEFYISTKITHTNGGGSIDPYTNITITNSAGDIRYVRGTGTGSPAISSGEIMYVTPALDLNLTALHYGSWTYPNLGNILNLTYMGVPPCRSKNRDAPVTPEYTDGVVLTKNTNLIGSKIGHPSNIDINQHGGSGQILVGRVSRIVPIKFAHPSNAIQPKNKVDACAFALDTKYVQGQTHIINLTESPLVPVLPVAGQPVFKSGRTTGVTPSGAYIDPTGAPKGNTNDCLITSTAATVSIEYCPGNSGTIQGTAVFEDCLLYEMDNEWFSDTGDSGAAVLMVDPADNTVKVAGMHIAGAFTDVNADNLADTPIHTIGVGCSIQHTYDVLNLANWEGTIIAPSSEPCIKIDGVCYTRSDETPLPATHEFIDEEFKNCSDCTSD